MSDRMDSAAKCHDSSSGGSAAKLRPRDVIDVLAAMPPEDLAALRARTERKLAQAKADVARLEHEGAQIAGALRAKHEESLPALDEVEGILRDGN